MDLGSIFLILALALLVALFVSRPFFDRRLMRARFMTAEAGLAEKKGPALDREKHHSSLLAERERLLTAIQELDFDFGLGKIPAEDYPEQRQYLLQSGAAVLRELDEMENSNAAGKNQSAEERVEAEAARLSLAGTKSSAQAKELDDLEAMIAERRRKREGKSAGFCPKCGKAVQTSDEFCPRCGKKL